jgi:hypothetical protein
VPQIGKKRRGKEEKDEVPGSNFEKFRYDEVGAV